jgi:hypothetical protein
MLCCVLAAVLTLMGFNGHHRQITSSAREISYTRHAISRTAFGMCCGVIAFEVVAAVAAALGGLTTLRPELVLLGATAVTALGAGSAMAHGTPTCRRAWALWALGASAGSALAELVDLHLLALHHGPNGAATIVLHGLAVVPGIVAGRLILQLGRADEQPAVFAPRR